jgi:glycosyltransferase involved in cell wall biosynthesis
MSAAPLVSVVVIGRNEGARLERCLASVAEMVRDEFETEVIYVDSGSTDGSVHLAQRMGAHTIALTAERPTAGMGRNAGWKAARGEVVLFLDGDTVLSKRFVVDSLAEFGSLQASNCVFWDGSVAVVWGHRREMFPRSSIYNEVMDLDWVYAPGCTEFCGGDALFRRDVLEATGGFDETLIAGEEPELCRRILELGVQILHVDRAMTKHDLAIKRFDQYWQRAMRAGHAYAEVSERFRGTESPFWEEDARRNRTRAMALMGVVLTGVIASVAMLRAWPMLLVAGLFLLVVVRTAWKARWKTHDAISLGMYGVHSHLQQVPIFVGQMQYRWNRRRGVKAALVEYKGR